MKINLSTIPTNWIILQIHWLWSIGLNGSFGFAVELLMRRANRIEPNSHFRQVVNLIFQLNFDWNPKGNAHCRGAIEVNKQSFAGWSRFEHEWGANGFENSWYLQTFGTLGEFARPDCLLFEMEWHQTNKTLLFTHILWTSEIRKCIPNVSFSGCRPIFILHFPEATARTSVRTRFFPVPTVPIHQNSRSMHESCEWHVLGVYGW